MYCETKTFTIGKFFVEKNSINTSPEYQRQGSVWNLDSRNRFLHTLFMKYDVPKIYMHKLKTNGGSHVYALIDGKQRLQCIWDFLNDDIELGNEEYRFTDASERKHAPFPQPGNKFSALSNFWQEQFKAIQLDVVLIHEADTDDIEELFLRLNNGEPLNAAEYRNAMGGDMCDLIRKVAEHNFFKKTLYNNENKRYRHYDLAARFLLIEANVLRNDEPFCILKKRFLDDMVREKDRMPAPEKKKLGDMVSKQLNVLTKIFDNRDVLLKGAGYPQLYYLFAKTMERDYADEKLLTAMKEFLLEFDKERTKIRKLTPDEKPDERHAYFDEFERLTQQANDKVSLEKRVATMIQFFLEKNPGTKVRDPQRTFSTAERYAIYHRSNGQCEECKKPLHYSEFRADHEIQWAHGGETSLDNARALCTSCNAKFNARVA